MIDLAPLDSVPALALQFPNPVPDLLEAFREGARIRSAEPQFQREQGLALKAGGQQTPAIPVAPHLAAQIGGRGPLLGAHLARAARSARYSSIVRLRSIEIRPFSLSIAPRVRRDTPRSSGCAASKSARFRCVRTPRRQC